MLNDFLTVLALVASSLLLGAGLLHLIPRLGSPGKRLAAALCRAPWLDLPITYFTAAPLFFGPIYAGWIGLLGAVCGQVAAVCIWTVLHEAANRKRISGDRKHTRIVHVLNRKVGRFRNHSAVWITAGAVPIFWVVRVAQYLLWPPIRMLVRFPKYDAGEWVNCSRQKFEGLVGHDLIWCLYCDWMTGIWSLGTEMLRNVESFWCPIRFQHDKKCANCAIDFPDVNGGWVDARSTMSDVASTLDAQYPGPSGVNSWFGYQSRQAVLTVDGRTLADGHSQAGDAKPGA
ncbi:MAG: hypothetical protein KF838_05285 [Phycisphaeraceae bacterium]|nr:MAG: hypothetical protein KF838_05285 [Phycisphaeraceae bacterium]